jgi:DNA end-binding protein Ku
LTNASTVWKGQLAFGLISFPIRLARAARKDRIPLRYVRKVSRVEDDVTSARPISPGLKTHEAKPVHVVNNDDDDEAEQIVEAVTPVRQSYVAGDQPEPIPSQELQHGYKVAPGQFAVVRSDELRQLRQPTSPGMAILRSVHMGEIDPIFLETSYYMLPGNGGEHPYGLFYLALKESGYAALADVAMHGRQHVLVIRPGARGLIAHTMYYVNEVRGNEEYAAVVKDLAPKELDLAKRFIEAIAAPFQPEEFTDRYREQLQALIASKEPVPSGDRGEQPRPASGKVIDIMDALRKSLAQVATEKGARKPVTPVAPPKARKRRA